ncbi:MAG: electron transfer flavoprotein subunit alpha/FixB family protein [Bacteroidetes bacterium]|nr:electron transfer flavoprotein subunit alpha/FixB family protein [Bacteroidota bacterium]
MTVLVYTENREGKFKKATFELLSYAEELAKNINAEVVALSIGDVSPDELNKLGNYGAKKVVTVKNDKLALLDNKLYTAAIAEVVKKENAKIVILADNLSGRALAPRLSAKLKAGLVSGVVAVPNSYDPFVIKKKVFTGKAFANVKINSDIKVLTLSQNSFGIKEASGNAPQIEAYNVELAGESNAKLVSVDMITGKLLLTDAEIVVSGGRGMKGPENWTMIEELAELLGAATACSRPVSDEGWRPHGEHVGQTGKIIAPTLYIACGISGAIQHVGGISSSKVIVAINKDPDAPIFEVADYGVVGDFQKILPQFTQLIKDVKNS